MTPAANSERYKNHRFPGEIISHGVWLYYRFTLSYRDVQEILLERGIEVSHEAIRQVSIRRILRPRFESLKPRKYLIEGPVILRTAQRQHLIAVLFVPPGARAF